MVAHLVRLKLQLLRNGLRRSVWQIIGLIFAVLYAIPALIGALVALGWVSTRHDVELQGTVTVLVGALLAVGWWVLPMLAFGVDATMDPARFALTAIPRRQMLLGLGVASIVGIPGVVSACVAVALGLQWWSTPLVLLVAVPAAVLGLATAVVGSRAFSSALAPVVGSRRFREASGVILMIPLMLIGPLMAGIGWGLSRGADALPQVARIIGYTPLGAAWSVPASVADGRWLAAALQLVIAIVTLGCLVVVWDRAITRAVTSPSGGGDSGTAGKGLGAFGWLPSRPWGAVAARCLAYWRRDSRYTGALVVVLFLPLLLLFMSRSSSGGSSGESQQLGGLVFASGPIIAFTLGWAISSDVSNDGTPFWLHVASGLRGFDDRLGRVVADSIVAVPLIVLVNVVLAAVTGEWGRLLLLEAVSLGALGASLGIASVTSALLVFPTRQAGDSPFTVRQGASAASMGVQFGGIGVMSAVMLVPGVLTVLSFAQPQLAWAPVVAGVSAVVIGGSAVTVGVRWGGRVLERRAPRLLESLVGMR